MSAYYHAVAMPAFERYGARFWKWRMGYIFAEGERAQGKPQQELVSVSDSAWWAGYIEGWKAKEGQQ